MRLIIRGDKSSAMKYIGFAKARLRDMKNIMNPLGLDYMRKPYRLPDADLVVESRYGLDSAWIVGRGIIITNEFLLDSPFNIIVSLLSPAISVVATTVSTESRFKVQQGTGLTNEEAHDIFLAMSWGAWTSLSRIDARYLVTPFIGTFHYTAIELRMTINVVATGDYTMSVQIENIAWPDLYSGAEVTDGINSWPDPDPSLFNVWTEIATIQGTDSQTIVLTMNDANGYPLIPPPYSGTGNAGHKGWRTNLRTVIDGVVS